MKKIMLIATLTVFAAGCARETETGGEGSILLSVDCGAEGRGGGTVGGWSYTDALKGESDIGSIVYLVFRNGLLEASRGTSTTAACRIDGISSGPKKVYAYVNVEAGRFRDIRTESDLDGIRITMKDNRINPGKGLTMAGNTTIDVPGGHASVEAGIPVSRHTARMMVARITNSLRAPLDTSRIILRRAFVTGPEEDSQTVLSGNIPPGQAAYPMKPVYFIPGDAMRLIVEAEADGVTYFYPVDIGTTRANTAYALDLTITRPGTTNPDSGNFAVVQGGIFAAEDFREYGNTIHATF